jgi:hypothetical protein
MWLKSDTIWKMTPRYRQATFLWPVPHYDREALVTIQPTFDA